MTKTVQTKQRYATLRSRVELSSRASNNSLPHLVKPGTFCVRHEQFRILMLTRIKRLFLYISQKQCIVYIPVSMLYENIFIQEICFVEKTFATVNCKQYQVIFLENNHFVVNL